MTTQWNYGIKVLSRGTGIGNNNAMTVCHLYDDNGDWFFLIDMDYDMDESEKDAIIETVRFKDAYGMNWHSWEECRIWTLADLDVDNKMREVIVDNIKMVRPLPLPLLLPSSDSNSTPSAFASAIKFIKDANPATNENGMDVIWELFKGALNV